MSSQQLFTIRNWLLLPNMMLISVTLLYEDWDFYFFYESMWGFWLTIFGLIFTVKASGFHLEDQPAPAKDNGYQAIACMLTEISMCFNIIITPLFWIFIADFSQLSWHGWGLV